MSSNLIRLAALAGVLAVGVVAGPVVADAHSVALESGSGPAGNGVQVGDTPNLLASGSYSAIQYDAKLAAVQSYAESRRSSGVAPASYVSSGISGWSQVHQFTNTWCLSAFVQSAMGLHYSGYYWASDLTTTTAKQTAIHGVIGIDEDAALTWINGQLEGVGSTWFYVKYTAPDAASFEANAMYDIDRQWPSFAKVHLTNKNYVWYQTSDAWHATGAVGYTNSGTYMSITDPFWSPNNSTGCVTGSSAGKTYSSSGAWGCVYSGYSAAKYYLSENMEWL